MLGVPTTYLRVLARGQAKRGTVTPVVKVLELQLPLQTLGRRSQRRSVTEFLCFQCSQARRRRRTSGLLRTDRSGSRTSPFAERLNRLPQRSSPQTHCV